MGSPEPAPGLAGLPPARERSELSSVNGIPAPGDGALLHRRGATLPFAEAPRTDALRSRRRDILVPAPVAGAKNRDAAEKGC